MTLNLLAFLLASLPMSSPAALELPPPPPGMRLLSRTAPSAVSQAPPNEEADEKVNAESADLEELRALEEVVLDPQAQPNAELLQSIRRLGVGNPIRHRLHDALEADLHREDSARFELPRITDLARFDVSAVQPLYDIPIEMQPLVARYIQFFQGPGRRWFRKWMSRSTRYLPMMQEILGQRGMPKDTVYLAMIESGFSAHAYSWAHASGPWQFISSTGTQYGLKQDFWVDERRDPIKATHAAAKYLRHLHQQFGHWYLAWAGYNAGGRKIVRLMARKGTDNFWALSEGRGFAKETKHYVPKLIACALVAKHPEAFGFSEEEFDFEEPLAFDEVTLTEAADLEVLARAAQVSVEALKDLNPELKRWCTPPASATHPYRLRLPQGTGTRFAEAYARVPSRERLAFRIHRVKRGDTLSQIAKRYRSAPEAIMRMNQLRSIRALKLNATLVVPVPSRPLDGSSAGQAVLARQVVKARRSGFTPPRPDEEIPAGTPASPTVRGPLATELVDGKTRIAYGVQGGDSLWSISQRFRVNLEDLRRWNRLSKRTRALKAGQVLFIWPGEKDLAQQGGTVIAHKAAHDPSSGPQTTHRLVEGETLWSVAQRYGVSVDELRRWNGIDNQHQVRAGEQLRLMTP